MLGLALSSCSICAWTCEHAHGEVKGGKIYIDKGDFANSPENALVATYVHELGNFLSVKQFGDARAKPLEDLQRRERLFSNDKDTGANFEDCVLGGFTAHDGQFQNIDANGVFTVTDPN